MKKERVRLLAGFLPALAMGILLLRERVDAETSLTTAAILEAAAFLIPFLLLLALRALEEPRSELRLRFFHRKLFPLVISTGFAVSLLSVLLNYGVVLLGGQYASATGGLSGRFWELFPVLALLPAVAEELFFRAGMLGMSGSAGTGAAILASGIGFALMHGSVQSLPATLAAGIVYAWLCYSTRSVWAAVLAHLMNNTLVLVMGYGAGVAEELGIWPYFLLAVLFLFCMFTALSLRLLETQLERGRIPRFRRGSLRSDAAVLVTSPGLWLLALLFVLKVYL